MIRSFAVSALCVLTLPLSGVLHAEETDWVVVQDNVPALAKTFVVNLATETPQHPNRNYHSGKNQISSTKAPQNDEGFALMFDIGKLANGNQYRLLTKTEVDLPFMPSNRNTERFWYSRFEEILPDGTVRKLDEGYTQSWSSAVYTTIDFPGDLVASPNQDTVPVELYLNLNSQSSDTYSGKWGIMVDRFLSGTHVNETSTLTVRIDNFGRADVSSLNISLSLTPHDQGSLSERASGELSSILTLDRAKLMVRRIAKDYSAVELAVIYGDLDKAPEKQMLIGKPLPPFTRYDLFRRQTVTLNDLTNKATADGHVVLLFGNESKPNPNQYRGYPSVDLPLPIQGILSAMDVAPDELEPQVVKSGGLFGGGSKAQPRTVVALVSSTVYSSTLFADWEMESPPFMILNDLADQTTISIQSPTANNYGYSGINSSSETLAQQLGLPANSTSALLIDGNGVLLDMEINVGDKLSAVLSRFRKTIEDN